jgi:outer membrane autotransporter protein
VLGAPSARQAFDQLSGEVHASGIAALIGSSGNVRSILSRRFQTGLANRRAATSFPLASYASFGSSAEHSEGAGGQALGYAAWGQVFGSWGSTSQDGGTTSLRHDEGGFLAGIDAVLAETGNVGAFVGYSRSTFSASDRNSSGSSDNFHLGFHAGTEVGALRLNGGAVHTWHALATSRTVAFPGFTERLSASYGARTAQIFSEAGYRFGTDALAFEPFAGLAHVHTTTNRFTETGGAAALTATRSTTATTFSTLGLRAFSQFGLGGMQATARGMVGWRHVLSGTAPTTRFNFAGGTGFSVSGAPITKDTALGKESRSASALVAAQITGTPIIDRGCSLKRPGVNVDR